MELRDLEKVNPMTKDFRGLSVTFNPDAFTDTFFFAVANLFRAKFTEEVRATAEPEPQSDATPLPESAQLVMRLVNDIADRIKLEGDKIVGEKNFFIALLIGTPDAPVLLEWDLTHEGVPVPCNEAGLQTLKHQTLEDLWHFVRDAANPKSQGISMIPQNQTTNESTQLPSASPATQAGEDPIM